MLPIRKMGYFFQRFFGRILFCLAVFCTAAGCGSSREARWDLEAGSSVQSQAALEGLEAVSRTGTAGEESVPLSEKRIWIHICGAVAVPGIYELPPDARVADAVEAAGGFLPEAADSYENLAAYLGDGQKIVIPYLEEVETDPYGCAVSGEMTGGETADNDLININTADQAQLMQLPGIGEARAEAILAYRNQHGGFGTPEEIMEVSGIKMSAYERIRDLITVGP